MRNSGYGLDALNTVYWYQLIGKIQGKVCTYSTLLTLQWPIMLFQSYNAHIINEKEQVSDLL